MQIKSAFAIVLTLFLTSCIVKKKTTYSKAKTVTVASNEDNILPPPPKRKKRKKENPKADAVVTTAMGFSGTRYRLGGTTKKGMDCSGLIYIALQDNNIAFPRVSHQMADEGKRVKLGAIEKGDLLFFKTSKSGKRVNHVGLVVEVDGKDIRFIHSTSSRGVIVSSLREGFWNHAFVKATRIL
ncbi:MAG: C40 family peptidase [Croceivirga sp.]